MKESARWIGFGFVVGTFIFLVDDIGAWRALTVFIFSGLGWMLIYMLGLPKFLMADPKDILPDDSKEKLDGNSRY